jgi:hypothetical protein
MSGEKLNRDREVLWLCKGSVLVCCSNRYFPPMLATYYNAKLICFKDYETILKYIQWFYMMNLNFLFNGPCAVKAGLILWYFLLSQTEKLLSQHKRLLFFLHSHYKVQNTETPYNKRPIRLKVFKISHLLSCNCSFHSKDNEWPSTWSLTQIKNHLQKINCVGWFILLFSNQKPS